MNDIQTEINPIYSLTDYEKAYSIPEQQVVADTYNTLVDKHGTLRLAEKAKKIPIVGRAFTQLQTWLLDVFESVYHRGLGEGNVDSLTGLPMKQSIESSAWNLMGYAIRNKLDEYQDIKELPDEVLDTVAVTVGLYDVNNLKQINDGYQKGHALGDRLLAGYGDILARKTRRGSELAGRWGGDEFVKIEVGAQANRSKQEVEEENKGLFLEIDELRQKLQLDFPHGTVSIGYARYTYRQMLAFYHAWSNLTPLQQQQEGFVQRYLLAGPDYSLYQLKGAQRGNRALEQEQFPDNLLDVARKERLTMLDFSPRESSS